MAQWHTVESARDQWVDAPTDDGVDEDATLTELLSAAKTAVLAYAPVFEGLAVVDGYIVNDPDAVPDSYRLAQLREARNQWIDSRQRAGYMDNNGEIQSLFLPWHGLVRPKRGKPVMV